MYRPKPVDSLAAGAANGLDDDAQRRWPVAHLARVDHASFAAEERVKIDELPVSVTHDEPALVERRPRESLSDRDSEQRPSAVLRRQVAPLLDLARVR